ncbi:MAG TPA: YjfB family protein [Rhodocyclaceae bacterium]|nr:YjfB family protein [Rhodocyclaceae bacterium]
MDITSSISNLATSMAQAKTMGDTQMAVLNKTLNIQTASAAQMIHSVVQSTAQANAAAQANNPPHLGNRVNTFA